MHGFEEGHVGAEGGHSTARMSPVSHPADRSFCQDTHTSQLTACGMQCMYATALHYAGLSPISLENSRVALKSFLVGPSSLGKSSCCFMVMLF